MEVIENRPASLCSGSGCYLTVPSTYQGIQERGILKGPLQTRSLAFHVAEKRFTGMSMITALNGITLSPTIVRGYLVDPNPAVYVNQSTDYGFLAYSPWRPRPIFQHLPILKNSI